MEQRKRRWPSSAELIFIILSGGVSFYFLFSAITSDTGLFSQIKVEAELEKTREDYDLLSIELAILKNKTQRLSENYLDLDLLDEQARAVLGLARADELILD